MYPKYLIRVANQSILGINFLMERLDYSKIYSPSKLSLFAQCPKAYHFTYLDPIYSKMKNELKKLPENIWSFFTLGKAVHNAITLFYHAPLEQRTEKQLKEYLLKTWASEVMWNKKPPLEKWGGFKSLEEERQDYGLALGMLENFMRMAEVDPEIEYLPTDDFRHSMDDYKNLITPLNGEVDISGKFDLIMQDEGGFLHIIDFKTGKKEDNSDFQLRFYKLLAEAKLKKPVQKASFYFLRSGGKKEFDLAEKTEGIKEEVLRKVGEIKNTQNFEPRPNNFCKFCLFPTFCPAKDKVREIIKTVTKEDIPDDLPF